MTWLARISPSVASVVVAAGFFGLAFEPAFRWLIYTGNPGPDANHPFHMGDMPNIEVGPDCRGLLRAVTTRVPVSEGAWPIFEAAIIIHGNPAKGISGEPKSGVSGGPRVAFAESSRRNRWMRVSNDVNTIVMARERSSWTAHPTGGGSLRITG